MLVIVCPTVVFDIGVGCGYTIPDIQLQYIAVAVGVVVVVSRHCCSLSLALQDGRGARRGDSCGRYAEVPLCFLGSAC